MNARLLAPILLALTPALLGACSGGEENEPEEESQEQAEERPEPPPPIPEEREWPAALARRCACRGNGAGESGAVLTIAQGKAALRAATGEGQRWAGLASSSSEAAALREAVGACMDREGGGAVRTCVGPIEGATADRPPPTPPILSLRALHLGGEGEDEPGRTFARVVARAERSAPQVALLELGGEDLEEATLVLGPRPLPEERGACEAALRRAHSELPEALLTEVCEVPE